MKKAEEVMDEFMRVWKNMMKYQNIKINPVEPNYDEIEKAFSEEKKIVATYEAGEVKEVSENEITQRKRRAEWIEGIKVEGLPILAVEEVDNKLVRTIEKQQEI